MKQKRLKIVTGFAPEVDLLSSNHNIKTSLIILALTEMFFCVYFGVNVICLMIIKMLLKSDA